MKTSFLALFVIFAFLRAAAWSDVPPPPATTILVANLAKYPGFKFSYTTESGKQPGQLVPLKEKQTIRSYAVTIRFFVEDGNGARSEWGSIETAYRPRTEAVTIQEVHREGKSIKVQYQIKHNAVPGEKSASTGSSPAIAFLLSAFSLGAVVLLARKNRTAPKVTFDAKVEKNT